MMTPKSDTYACAVDGVERTVLTPAEEALVRYFRKMDDRSQEFILGLADEQSADCPRRPRASLRLVIGGSV